MDMIRVGVVRGGISNEYEVSLATGANVLDVLREKLSHKYLPVDILISKEGDWYIRGKKIDINELRASVDVVFNALHGEYGEDGQIQSVFEAAGIAYVGSGPVASAVAMHKKRTKDHLKESGIKMPLEYIVADYRTQGDVLPEVYLKEAVQKIFLSFSPPWVIKPLQGGSSVGVSIAKTREQLLNALRAASEFPGEIMVEEYIAGKEATVAVTENFRGEPIYSFLPIEIRVPKDRIFDYEMKYSGLAQEISPGNFSQEEKEVLQNAARIIHKDMGLRHYSRSDFIVSKRGIYMLEVNTLPGLTRESLVPKSLEPVGSHMGEFIDHIITLALN